LIPHKYWPRNAIGVVFKAVGSKFRNPVELIQTPVKAIPAGFRYNIDDAAASAAIHRHEIVRENTEFLHGIRRDLLSRNGVELVVIIPAIEHHIGRGRSQSIDGNTNAPRVSGANRRIGFRNIARSDRQIVRIARDRRQFSHFSGIDPRS
jgi:hypothetical protein